MRILSWTCLGLLLEEDHYLERAVLSTRLAHRYDIEVADFTRARRVVRCRQQYYRRHDIDLGLVTGWCWRKWMSDAFQVQ